MAGMMFDPRHSLDHGRDARQRPEIGTEPMRAGTSSERALDGGQLLRTELRLATGAPGALEALPSLGRPSLMPMIGGGAAHAQRLRHCGLRLAAREPPRGLEPPSFQRSKIPSGSAAGRGHASA